MKTQKYSWEDTLKRKTEDIQERHRAAIRSYRGTTWQPGNNHKVRTDRRQLLDPIEAQVGTKTRDSQKQQKITAMRTCVVPHLGGSMSDENTQPIGRCDSRYKNQKPCIMLFGS